MKLEFESVLFGLAFLALALISMPKDGDAPEPESTSQSAQDTSPS